MKQRLHVLALLVVVLVALAGCGARSSDTSNSAKQEGYAGAPAPASPPMYDAVAEESRAAGDASFTSAEQKLIRNADISLDVENIDGALEEVRRIVKAVGGFAAESSISGGTGDNRRAWLTLRVPAAKLDVVLEDIEGLGKRTNLHTGDQDVTLHYVDLEARIRNAQRQEERLLDILGKADTVEDILRVEQELARVRGQLESMTAEFRYLSDRVDYGTISVSLRETPKASPTISSSGLKGVWQRGVTGLVNSVNGMLIGLGNLLVLILTALPYLLLLAAVGIPLLVVLRKLRANRPRTPDA